MTETIDVAIPTWQGEECIGKAIESVERAARYSDVEIGSIRIDDRKDTGNTLPEARTNLISRVETDWFLFLDDDVRMRRDALQELLDARTDHVGAVQSRKARHERDDTWPKWRPVRATFFATLCRTQAFKGYQIPLDLKVLEEEWLRQQVEQDGWLWIFNHRAIVNHDNQNRHTTAQEGYVAGKYGLLPAWYVLLHVPYSLARMDRPAQHTKRAVGYLRGRAGL